ncbi:Beta-glucosidase [Cyphellophora attinorum]|uniref:beta-glucosidase n=1 Tax=Cyphellophora attinorum TaxID=1664694 RepID=A0A0N1HAL4_9EURO|nr:Beta-glucosidase [Phialophora attinorum]KPI41063.1 Beta-glucosidase [Phialophora attinorum]
MKAYNFLVLLLTGPVSVFADTLPWMNQSLSVEDRLKLFVGSLNNTQKQRMTSGDTELDDNGTGVNACIGHISADESSGVPGICMGDGPAGVSNAMTNVTTFPAPVLSASSWNSTVQYVYGQAMAAEHRGKGRNVVLAPTLNILRSPLWGRSAETFSEDPWLTSRFAVAAVQGIQSQGVLACPKHFAAYNQETNRFGPLPDYNAVDAQATVKEADPGCVMCSYNKVNGQYACQNDYLLNTVLKDDWGFQGFVVADWYFSTRSTVPSIMGGLDINMPGGDLYELFGLADFFGEPFTEALGNGTVTQERLDDMVERVWRYMFKLGQVDYPTEGNSTAPVRTQEHLDLAQSMVEDGAVLLKNEAATLPLSPENYTKIAVFGIGATKQNQVTLNHGGFVKDSTMVVQAPLDALDKRSTAENITLKYAEAYPGNGIFPTIPPSMFKEGGVNVTYFTNLDFERPANTTDFLPNITSATYPDYLWESYPDTFSAIYEATFLPNTTGGYHFSMVGQGTALLYLNDVLVGNMSYHNFGGNYIQGYAYLEAGAEVKLTLKYDMGYSLLTGAFGITLGVSTGNLTRDSEAEELAEWADISVVFANDRISEGMDSGVGLALPGDQNAVIDRLSKASSKTVVVLNTNSAILMPWIDQVDAVMEIWYPGQQVGLALERLLFGDVSPSGHLPVTFPMQLDDAILINTNIEAPFDEGLYVGYKMFDKKGIEPLFPFGHGLTYTDWQLENLDVTKNDTAISATLVLENTGDVDARQVVQLYVAFPEAADEPPKLLKAFEKCYVEAGQNVALALSVAFDDLQVYSEETKDWEMVAGEYNVMLGFSAGDMKLQQAVQLP